MQPYQQAIDEWAQSLAEPYWPPLSQFARLAEEVGEVGRLLNHMYGSKPKKAEEAQQHLGEELADVMFALICMANRHGIDLDAEMRRVIEKSHTRDKARFRRKDSQPDSPRNS